MVSPGQQEPLPLAPHCGGHRDAATSLCPWLENSPVTLSPCQPCQSCTGHIWAQLCYPDSPASPALGTAGHSPVILTVLPLCQPCSWAHLGTGLPALQVVPAPSTALSVPGGEGGLLAALDVDGAELLHAPQARGRHAGVGQVRGLLAAPGAAGRAQALVAAQRRAPGRGVVLHRALHAVLLEQLLVDELVVLVGEKQSGHPQPGPVQPLR